MKKIMDKIIDKMKSSDSLTDDEEIVRYGLEIMITQLMRPHQILCKTE